MIPIPPARLDEILARFPMLSFLVIGDCMLDRYLWGSVERISPEAPVPIVRQSGESLRLGGAANVAANLSALGARVSLLGVLGEDADAALFREALAGRGIGGDDLLADASRPTTVKMRVIAHNQQVVRIDREGREPVPAPVRERLASRAAELVAQVDGVILSDYAKGVVAADLAARVIAAARSAGRFVAVDPKRAEFSSYAGASLVTPNQGEASLASGIPITDLVSLTRAGRKLLDAVGGEAILITRGEQGMSLFERDGAVTHLATVARDVYDVTGAGDTVISSFLMAIGGGATPLEAALLSNQAAGVVIRGIGATTLSRDELRAAALAEDPS